MVVNMLFDGLQRPAVSVKLDTAPIDSFLERLLSAVKSTDDEMKLIREENQKLSNEVAALRAAVKDNNMGDLRTETNELKSRVKSLEEKLATAEGNIAEKANTEVCVYVHIYLQTCTACSGIFQSPKQSSKLKL